MPGGTEQRDRRAAGGSGSRRHRTRAWRRAGGGCRRGRPAAAPISHTRAVARRSTATAQASPSRPSSASRRRARCATGVRAPARARIPPRTASRHQFGSPLSPTQRAVSAGMLCVAISCCCSPSASEEAKRVRAEADDRHDREQHKRSQRRSPPPAPARARRRGASTTNGSTSPAEAFTPTPTHEQRRGAAIGSPSRARSPAASSQRARKHEQHERVVVRAAHRQLEQHRVQADETAATFAERPIFSAALARQCHRPETRSPPRAPSAPTGRRQARARQAGRCRA